MLHFILSYLVLSLTDPFFSIRGGMGVDPKGRGSGKELERVKAWETVIGCIVWRGESNKIKEKQMKK